jgi:hypothetical protein
VWKSENEVLCVHPAMAALYDELVAIARGSELDVLAVGNLLLLKGEQDSSLKQDYRTKFSLD